MADDKADRRSLLILIAAFALLKLLIHLVTNIWGGYGYFRDELYYLACSSHPALGYVDQPPFSIYVLALWRLVAGDSIFSLRLIPALAGSATVFFTGLIALSMGGRAYAIAIACLASTVSIINLAVNSIYSMNAIDVLLWTIASYVVLRLIQTKDPKFWILLGWVLGVGLLNKISVLWLGAGIAAGFLFTRDRTWFRTRWPYIAGAIAVGVFIPYVIWNFTHDFAHLEFMHNASTGKYSGLNAGSFLLGQLLIANPLTVVVWMAGLVYFFGTSRGRAYMPLGILYVVACVILIVNGTSKPEYLSPAYGVLFAGGGVLFEQLRRPFSVVRPILVVVLLSGFVLAPVVLPILPVERYLRFADAMGIKPTTSEEKELSELPQFYADMFGWEEKARAVSRVYQRLSQKEKAGCIAYSTNYGRCGAIDFFRNRYPLPPVYGSHNNYWLWGPPPDSPSVVLILGGTREDYTGTFASVESADTVSSPYVMPYENTLTIFVCRTPRVVLAQRWPSIKHYD